ncbi:MAG: NUDIX domain-containing protein, partial [Candidatus Zixiibacteriota bacterium]
MNPRAQKMYEKKEATLDTQVRVGVGVVVRDDRGWILLEKRHDRGLWGLPGGKIEPGESISEAAMREVKEETGLNVRTERLLGVYSKPKNRIVTFLDSGDVVHLVDILLEATIIDGDLSCSRESEQVRFFDPRNLP